MISIQLRRLFHALNYPIHNKLAHRALQTIDTLLKVLPIKKNFPIKPPKKILITNLAHLGDVILTTTLLTPLKKAFPDAEIGMLIGTWSKSIIEKHPLINQIHYHNHWKVNRSHKCRLSPKEIQKYDLAIDCNFHFPNSAALLYRAKIPVRIGFTSAGFGPLLTHSLPWEPSNTSAAQSFFSLLQFLNIKEGIGRPTLPPVPSKPNHSIVIHMGTANPQKEWDLKKWRALAKRLKNDRLIFTGQGEREKNAIEWVIHDLPNAENLCDKLSWEEFVSTIQGANLLLSVDTSAGHIASAVDTPAILLFTGMNPPELWRPFGNNIRVITGQMPCSPCYKGCALMGCMRVISVAQVESAIKSMTARPTSALSRAANS